MPRKTLADRDYCIPESSVLQDFGSAFTVLSCQSERQTARGVCLLGPKGPDNKPEKTIRNEEKDEQMASVSGHQRHLSDAFH